MAHAFRSLADILRAPVLEAPNQVRAEDPPRSLVVASETADDLRSSPMEDPHRPPAGRALDEALSSLGVARLAAQEAFQRSVRRALESLARDVLARELALAPVDVEALVRRAHEDFSVEEPVCAVLAPHDAARVQCAIPIRIDEGLRSGDLVLEVRDGVIDARFALRVEAALAEAAA